MKLELKAKHFLSTECNRGNGVIKEALKEIYPNKRIFQGVEMTNVGGKHYYHQIYSTDRFEKGKAKSIFSTSNPNDIIETIILSENYKEV